jgi:hypothetical protein
MRITVDKIRAERIRPHHVRQENIAIEIRVASETRTQVWRRLRKIGLP